MANIDPIRVQAIQAQLYDGAMAQAEHTIAQNLTDSEKWTTSTEVGDPDSADLPLPAGWRILLRPIPSKEKTAGGLYLPEQVRDNQMILQVFAKVLSIGPLAWNRPDYQLPEGQGWCKPGDIVMVPRHAGNAVEVSGVKCKIVNDEEILAVIPDITKIKRA